MEDPMAFINKIIDDPNAVVQENGAAFLEKMKDIPKTLEQEREEAAQKRKERKEALLKKKELKVRHNIAIEDLKLRLKKKANPELINLSVQKTEAELVREKNEKLRENYALGIKEEPEPKTIPKKPKVIVPKEVETCSEHSLQSKIAKDPVYDGIEEHPHILHTQKSLNMIPIDAYEAHGEYGVDEDDDLYNPDNNYSTKTSYISTKQTNSIPSKKSTLSPAKEFRNTTVLKSMLSMGNLLSKNDDEEVKKEEPAFAKLDAQLNEEEKVEALAYIANSTVLEERFPTSLMERTKIGEYSGDNPFYGRENEHLPDEDEKESGHNLLNNILPRNGSHMLYSSPSITGTGKPTDFSVHHNTTSVNYCNSPNDKIADKEAKFKKQQSLRFKPSNVYDKSAMKSKEKHDLSTASGANTSMLTIVDAALNAVSFGRIHKAEPEQNLNSRLDKYEKEIFSEHRTQPITISKDDKSSPATIAIGNKPVELPKNFQDKIKNSLLDIKEVPFVESSDFIEKLNQYDAEALNKISLDEITNVAVEHAMLEHADQEALEKEKQAYIRDNAMMLMALGDGDDGSVLTRDVLDGCRERYNENPQSLQITNSYQEQSENFAPAEENLANITNSSNEIDLSNYTSLNEDCNSNFDEDYLRRSPMHTPTLSFSKTASFNEVPGGMSRRTSSVRSIASTDSEGNLGPSWTDTPRSPVPVKDLPKLDLNSILKKDSGSGPSSVTKLASGSLNHAVPVSLLTPSNKAMNMHIKSKHNFLLKEHTPLEEEEEEEEEEIGFLSKLKSVSQLFHSKSNENTSLDTLGLGSDSPNKTVKKSGSKSSSSSSLKKTPENENVVKNANKRSSQDLLLLATSPNVDGDAENVSAVSANEKNANESNVVIPKKPLLSSLSGSGLMKHLSSKILSTLSIDTNSKKDTDKADAAHNNIEDNSIKVSPVRTLKQEFLDSVIYPDDYQEKIEKISPGAMSNITLNSNQNHQGLIKTVSFATNNTDGAPSPILANELNATNQSPMLMNSSVLDTSQNHFDSYYTTNYSNILDEENEGNRGYDGMEEKEDGELFSPLSHENLRKFDEEQFEKEIAAEIEHRKALGIVPYVDEEKGVGAFLSGKSLKFTNSAKNEHARKVAAAARAEAIAAIAERKKKQKMDIKLDDKLFEEGGVDDLVPRYTGAIETNIGADGDVDYEIPRNKLEKALNKSVATAKSQQLLEKSCPNMFKLVESDRKREIEERQRLEMNRIRDMELRQMEAHRPLRSAGGASVYSTAESEYSDVDAVSFRESMLDVFPGQSSLGGYSNATTPQSNYNPRIGSSYGTRGRPDTGNTLPSMPSIYTSRTGTGGNLGYGGADAIEELFHRNPIIAKSPKYASRQPPEKQSNRQGHNTDEYIFNDDWGDLDNDLLNNGIASNNYYINSNVANVKDWYSGDSISYDGHSIESEGKSVNNAVQSKSTASLPSKTKNKKPLTRAQMAQRILSKKLRSRYSIDHERQHEREERLKQHSDHYVQESNDIVKTYMEEIDGWKDTSIPVLKHSPLKQYLNQDKNRYRCLDSNSTDNPFDTYSPPSNTGISEVKPKVKLPSISKSLQY